MNKFYPFALLILAISASRPTMAQERQWPFFKHTAAKSISAPAFQEMTKPTGTPTVTVTVNATDTVAKVSKYIYGTNANLYSNITSSDSSLVKNLRLLSPNIIRYPGGLHSEQYFWNATWDYNLKSTAHPSGWFKTVPAGLPDSVWATSKYISAYSQWMPAEGYWTFALSDYYKLLRLTGAEGLITVNYNYARYGTSPNPVQTAAHLAADWVRYDNGRTKFWEVGNESAAKWSTGYRIKTVQNKDGQPEYITGALYGKHFKVFVDSMRQAAREINSTIYIGAQDDDGFFTTAGDSADYFIAHNYFTPYQTNSAASVILNSAATGVASDANFVNSALAKSGKTAKPIALTEWNIFAQGSKQTASYINGMHAALLMGELIKNKFGMANRWDIANAWSNGDDMGMFGLADNGSSYSEPKWNPRPSFFYMYYFQKYFGDYMVTSTSSNSEIVAYASRFSSGQTSAVIINKSTTAQTVNLKIQNFGHGDRYYIYSLTGGTDNGEFSLQVNVNGTTPDYTIGGPISTLTDIKALSATTASGVIFTSPARSVQYVLVDKGSIFNVSSKALDQPSLNMFPNPARDFFRVDLASGGFSKIEVLNLYGKLVYSEKLTSEQKIIEVAIPNLSSGLYLVKIYKGTEPVVLKLVKE